jgi:hypothetical protein
VNVAEAAVEGAMAAEVEAAGFFSVVGRAGFASKKVLSISKMSGSCGIF